MMARYAIKVTEKLSRTVIVEAESAEDGVQKVKNVIDQVNAAIGPEDYDEREVIPSPSFSGGTGAVPDGMDVSGYWDLGSLEEGVVE